MGDIFLGKPLHWALWAALVVPVYLMGRVYLHVRAFPVFILVLLALAAAAVAALLLTSRGEERLTRDPMVAEDPEVEAHSDEA